MAKIIFPRRDASQCAACTLLRLASMLAFVTQWGQADSYSMITVQLVETSWGFTANSAFVSCLAPLV